LKGQGSLSVAQQVNPFKERRGSSHAVSPPKIFKKGEIVLGAGLGENLPSLSKKRRNCTTNEKKGKNHDQLLGGGGASFPGGEKGKGLPSRRGKRNIILPPPKTQGGGEGLESKKLRRIRGRDEG